MREMASLDYAKGGLNKSLMYKSYNHLLKFNACFISLMSSAGVSKAILEGAGPAVENECAVLGMVSCCFCLQPIES